jgi:predicted metal-dependent phosphoesterase TrpH
MNTGDTGYADLHIHSTVSDGVLSPAEIVNHARCTGLRAVGIADHDCIDGIEPASREGERCGVEVIPGVEMSTSAGAVDVHLLGYLFDPADPALREYLRFFQETREQRAIKIVKRLNELGFALRHTTVMERSGTGSVGRMHIAQALVEDGFCRTTDEAFGRFLRDGGPAFIEKYRISVGEAIRVIHKAGGLTFLAHPGFYDDEKLVADLFEAGLDGLEVYNPKHSEKQIVRFRTIIREKRALASGGSDYHGEKKNGSPLGRFRVPYALVAGMKERAARHRASIDRMRMSLNRGGTR